MQLYSTSRTVKPGDRLGFLTVVNFVRKEVIKPNYVKRYWKFRCKCGTEVIDLISKVKQRKWPSCGCHKLTWLKMGRKPLPFGEASFNHLLSIYKRGARTRGLVFTLTKEEFRQLTSQNCYYCGTSPQRKHLAMRKVHGHYIYNGLDRIDNNLGYMLKNIVPSCKICNYAKKNVPQNEFIAWINRLKNHRTLGKSSNEGETNDNQ